MKKKGIIIALCILALGMGIGYSILQTQLKITGTGTVDGAEFEVGITGIKEFDKNISLKDSYSDNKAVTTNLGYTSTTANFSATFYDVHDVKEYVISIKNTGGVTAYVNSVNVTSTEGSAIKVTTPIDLANTYIIPGQTVHYLVRLEYTKPIDYTQYSTDVEVTLDIIQAEIQDATRICNMENSSAPYIFFEKEPTTTNFYIGVYNLFISEYTPIYYSIDQGEFQLYEGSKTILDNGDYKYIQIEYPAEFENSYINFKVMNVFNDGTNYFHYYESNTIRW